MKRTLPFSALCVVRPSGSATAKQPAHMMNGDQAEHTRNRVLLARAVDGVAACGAFITAAPASACVSLLASGGPATTR